MDGNRTPRFRQVSARQIFTPRQPCGRRRIMRQRECIRRKGCEFHRCVVAAEDTGKRCPSGTFQDACECAIGIVQVYVQALVNFGNQ